jgi:hypothetical protein
MSRRCYNISEVMNVSIKVEQLLQEAQHLSYAELQILYKGIVQQLATPLRNPEEIFDDWNEAEVDNAYADTW